jgi:hypothetical protein
MVNFLYIFKKYDDKASVHVNFFSSGNWGRLIFFRSVSKTKSGSEK